MNQQSRECPPRAILKRWVIGLKLTDSICVLSEPLLSSHCFTHQDELLSPENSCLTTASPRILGEILQIWQTKCDVFFSFPQLWCLKGGGEGRHHPLSLVSSRSRVCCIPNPERLQNKNKKNHQPSLPLKKRKQGMHPGLRYALNLHEMFQCVS